MMFIARGGQGLGVSSGGLSHRGLRMKPTQNVATIEQGTTHNLVCAPYRETETTFFDPASLFLSTHW